MSYNGVMQGFLQFGLKNQLFGTELEELASSVEMGLLTWVLIPLAIAVMLAARYHEAVLSVAHLCALVSTCFLALTLYQRRKSFGLHLSRPSSPQGAGSTRIDVPLRQMNNSLYELHKPTGTPSMQILFFQGLLSVEDSDADVRSWKSEDVSVIWPREWLAEDFPGAHVFTVSYNEGVRSLDMFLVGENLASDMMDGGIGQVPYCPVILVGYCVGGLVIKQLCLQSRKKFHSGETSSIEGRKLGMFLDNVRGVFYYGTPHRGSSVIANIADGPLFEYFKVLNKNAARLNSDFDNLRASYPKWKVYGLGEVLHTKSGMFQGHVVVPEATSRDGEEFNVVEADHNTICRPRNKVDRRYYALRNLINRIVTDMEDEAKVQDSRPQNFQTLPKEIVAIDVQVHAILAKFDNVKKLGLAGMGGLGKTTLAKAVFNELCPKFEYSCFVPNMKLIAGTEEVVKDVVWEHMHHHGKKVEGGERWASLRGRELLLVLDDICLRDEKVLQDLAHDSVPESIFIATSRDQDLLRSLDEVVVVPFLATKNAEALFMKCAFPNQAEPPKESEIVMKNIIKKCDGLPLTLEVLGKYLKGKTNVEVWEQTLHALTKAEEISSLNGRLWEKLRPSFDGLTDIEQQIFLDASTFFSTIERRTWRVINRWTLREAKAAWKAAYGGSEQLLWQTLVDRSLVYFVEEDDTIKLHEQLQSLGQKIASEPSNIDKLRVWDGEVGLDMLQSTTEEVDGKGIHALKLSTPRDAKCIYLPKAALSQLKNLQFLQAYGRITIDGAQDETSVPTEVVLLRCVGQDFFNPTLQIRLAVLELSWWSEDPLPPSIGQLENLKHLTIRHCRARELPSSLGKLRGLQRLTLDGLPEVKSLPDSFGQLSSLNYLKFSGCVNLHALPESFGQLKGLHSLEFYTCRRLNSLPESFGQLSTLSELELQCESLRYLPESFGKLPKLQRLRIDAHLERWPDSVGQLKALRDLEIGYYSARSIPDCIRRLQSLQSFILHLHRDLLEPLPPWLMTPNEPTKLSSGARIDFRVRDGCFFCLSITNTQLRGIVGRLLQTIALHCEES